MPSRVMLCSCMATGRRMKFIFREELDELSQQLSMPIHYVLSDDKAWVGEKGYIDQEKLTRLVPGLTERDVFLCGPPPMMAGVISALSALGVPKKQIHYEIFSLHVSG